MMQTLESREFNAAKASTSVLDEITFSDLYLGRQGCWLAGVPGTSDPAPAPASAQEELSLLRSKCEEIHERDGADEFGLRHNRVVYRVSVMQTLGDHVYVLRRMPREVPQLSALNLDPRIVAAWMQPKLTGMLVVSGAYRNGKTTTASALVAGRLMTHGGVGITIEDPPEMPLEGRHGDGICYQTQPYKGSFAESCRRAARWAPSVIFLGETREPETAVELLRASINGRLTYSTVHADSISSCIQRLYTLAASATSHDDAASLLADGLLGVLHQRLEMTPHGPRLEVEHLWVGGDVGDAVRTLIRGKNFAQIPSYISMQAKRAAPPFGGRPR